MSKKKKTLDELLEEVLVPEGEQPYEIPENWVWTKLGVISEWGSGGTPKSTSKEYYDGDIPWLIISDLNDGIVSNSEKKITQLGLKNSSAKLVPKDTLLVAMYGSIGKLGITDMDCATNQAIAFAKEPKVHTKFLFYYLLCIREKLKSLGKGGTQQNISQTVLKEVLIPISPIKEQAKLVNKIEILFAKLDDAKKLIKEVKETSEIRRTAVLKKAFAGDLTSNWRIKNKYKVQKQFEEFHEKRLAYIDSEKELKKYSFSNYSIDEDVQVKGDFPENWIQLPIGLICECIVPGRDKPKSFSGDIPWITIPDINSDFINSSKDGIGLTKEEVKQVNAKIIPQNSVVMTCVGRFGISAIVNNPSVINQQLHAFLPSEMVLPKYLMYQIRTLEKYMSEIATSTTIAYLNKKNANSLPIKLAPIEEQREIVTKLEYLLEKEEQFISSLPSIDKIDQLKQSILSKAFKGELGTNDLSDEPAVELLKSILQEKL